MNLEEQIAEHLTSRGHSVAPPRDNLDDVMRRGRRRQIVARASAVTAVVAALVAAPLVFNATQRTTVEFDVANPGASEFASGPTAPASEPEPAPGNVLPGPSDEVPEQSEPPAPPRSDTVPLADLGSPVLAYGPYEHDQLHFVDGDTSSNVDNVSGTVDVAVPDGRGGVVWQHSATQSIGWSEAVTGAGKEPVILAEANTGPQGREEEIHLRGVLPEGRVLYSIRPAKNLREGDVERFYAVDLFVGAEPELLAEVGAYESWTVGPVTVADCCTYPPAPSGTASSTGRAQVYASCHLHCSLRRGPVEERQRSDSIYDGLAIEGLTATPEGRYFAFVEFDHVLLEQGRDPELVIFEGTSFVELARVRIPWPKDTPVGLATVSMRRRPGVGQLDALVSLGNAGVPISPPTTPFLVRDVLEPNPEVRPVDFEGAVLWMHP